MSNEIRYFNDGEQATASVLNRPTEDLDKKSQYMSKVDFENAAEMRRNAYAGSGVIESGDYVNGSYYNMINHGLYCRRNNDLLGYEKSLIFRDSRSSGNVATNKVSSFNINGVHLKFSGFERLSGVYEHITLPEANTSVSIITDSTTMPEMKQGDIAILNDLNRDVILNGEFSNTDNWEILENTRNGFVTASDGNLTVDDNSEDEWTHTRQHLRTIPGIKYRVQAKFLSSTATNGKFEIYLTQNGSRIFGTLSDVNNPIFDHEFIADGSEYISLGNHTDGSATFDYVRVNIVHDKGIPIVALQDTTTDDLYSQRLLFEKRDSISRQDLVFLETWHEDVSEKDMVYPYGNIQYKNGNTDGLSGIQEGSFSGADTYSLFGNWMIDEEKTLVGKGYVWSTMSNEDKLTFSSNKENNIYKDGDKIIQVRYRIRVVKGLGNDWENVKTVLNTGSTYYLKYNEASHSRVQAKGNRSILPNEYSDKPYDFKTANSPYLESAANIKSEELGIFAAQRKAGYPAIAHENKCFAMPIALVQRRNNGAYDPVFNPEGSAVFSDGKQWFETTDSHGSIVDCFNNKGDSTIGTVSGRPDRLYSDEINERDVEDLRMSAHKRDYKELMDEYNNKAIAGEIRGKEILYTQTLSKGTGSSDLGRLYLHRTYCSNNIFNGAHIKVMVVDPGDSSMKSGEFFDAYIKDYNGAQFYTHLPSGKNGTIASGKGTSGMTFLIPGYNTQKKLFVQNNTLTHTDVIGDPRKLQERVKYTVIDGTAQTVDLKVNDYVLNSDGKYYRSLTERDGIDLDTDDFTSVTNWLNLGSDGTIGGYKQEWLEHGIEGSPLIVGENGESLLPVERANNDVTRMEHTKLYKKNYGLEEVLITKKDGTFVLCNYGAEYVGGQVRVENTISILLNEGDTQYSDLGYASEQEMLDLMIVLVTYKTKTNFLELTNTRKFLNISDQGTRLKSNNAGSEILTSLINKVSISGSSDINTAKLLTLNIAEPDKLWTFNEMPTKHSVFDTRADSDFDDNPCVKVLPYLAQSNSVAKLHYVFKEMKFDDVTVNQDGTPTDTWGDDEQFQVIDNVSMIDDDNFNKVLYGQKSFDLPYFIED